MKVNVFYNTAMPAYYRKTARYKAAVLGGLGVRLARLSTTEVNLIFINAKQSRAINKKFLKHDYPTDVITFEYPAGQAVLSDIYICFDVAKKQANQQGHSALKELLIIAAHGALHLQGYNDDTPQKRNKMNTIAEKIALKLL